MVKKLDIKINQSIISLMGKNLYQSQFGIVVLRELIQNALDAGSSQIDISYRDHILTVRDNGCGIPQIENLMDTIGESSKDINNPETIGGLGMAKLAIFGCKQFKFISGSGSFQTGFLLDPEEKIPSGTLVSVEFEDQDVTYLFEKKIKSYLESINRNCLINYNGLDIIRPDLKSVRFGDRTESLCDTADNGFAIIRVNGLPTFKKAVRNLSETIFIDYPVRVSPYSGGYPLTSNRDSFKESSSEGLDLESRINQISRKLEVDKKLEELRKLQKITVTFRNKKFTASEGITADDFKVHAATITAYERYIRQIADVEYHYSIEGCRYGLLNDDLDYSGCYSDESGFMIRKTISRKGEILTIALHEFVHFMGYGKCGHDQEFSYHLTDLTGKVLERIFSGEFRK